MLKLGRYILTLKNCIEALSYASTAYVVASYGPCVKIWATCENFLGKWFTAPLAENCPYAYGYDFSIILTQELIHSRVE